MTLRPYQSAAIASVRASWERGYQRVVLCLPTGGGKTPCAAEIARTEIASGGCVAMVTGSLDLYRQNTGKMPPGTVHMMAQTLDARGEREIARLTGGRVPSTLIVEECHHSVSPQWGRVLSWFACRTVGLTATPSVPGMASEWDDLVIGATPVELERDNYLSPLRIVTHGEPDLSRVRIRGDEYDPAQLEAIVSTTELRGDVVATWLREADDAPTILFGVTRAHSRALAQDFRAAAVSAEHIDGDSPDRADVMERFRSGETRILCNAQLLGEGIDTAARCVVLARPLHSEVAYLQQVGRCRSPGSIGLILDHGGNLQRHGHPRADRTYELLPGTRRTKRAAAASGHRTRLVLEHPAPAYVIEPEMPRNAA